MIRRKDYLDRFAERNPRLARIAGISAATLQGIGDATLLFGLFPAASFLANYVPVSGSRTLGDITRKYGLVTDLADIGTTAATFLPRAGRTFGTSVPKDISKLSRGFFALRKNIAKYNLANKTLGKAVPYVEKGFKAVKDSGIPKQLKDIVPSAVKTNKLARASAEVIKRAATPKNIVEYLGFSLRMNQRAAFEKNRMLFDAYKRDEHVQAEQHLPALLIKDVQGVLSSPARVVQQIPFDATLTLGIGLGFKGIGSSFKAMRKFFSPPEGDSANSIDILAKNLEYHTRKKGKKGLELKPEDTVWYNESLQEALDQSKQNLKEIPAMIEKLKKVYGPDGELKFTLTEILGDFGKDAEKFIGANYPEYLKFLRFQKNIFATFEGDLSHLTKKIIRGLGVTYDNMMDAKTPGELFLKSAVGRHQKVRQSFNAIENLDIMPLNQNTIKIFSETLELIKFRLKKVVEPSAKDPGIGFSLWNHLESAIDQWGQALAGNVKKPFFKFLDFRILREELREITEKYQREGRTGKNYISKVLTRIDTLYLDILEKAGTKGKKQIEAQYKAANREVTVLYNMMQPLADLLRINVRGKRLPDIFEAFDLQVTSDNALKLLQDENFFIKIQTYYKRLQKNKSLSEKDLKSVRLIIKDIIDIAKAKLLDEQIIVKGTSDNNLGYFADPDKIVKILKGFKNRHTRELLFEDLDKLIVDNKEFNIIKELKKLEKSNFKSIEDLAEVTKFNDALIKAKVPIAVDIRNQSQNQMGEMLLSFIMFGPKSWPFWRSIRNYVRGPGISKTESYKGLMVLKRAVESLPKSRDGVPYFNGIPVDDSILSATAENPSFFYRMLGLNRPGLGKVAEKVGKLKPNVPLVNFFHSIYNRSEAYEESGAYEREMIFPPVDQYNPNEDPTGKDLFKEKDAFLKKLKPQTHVAFNNVLADYALDNIFSNLIENSPKLLDNEVLEGMAQVDPKRAASAAYAVGKATEYLRSQIPPSVFNPYNAGLSTGDYLSDLDKQTFIEKLEAVQNPKRALLGIQDGSISAGEIAALKNVYPQTVLHIKRIIAENLAEIKRELDYNALFKLELLTDLPLVYLGNPEIFLRNNLMTMAEAGSIGGNRAKQTATGAGVQKHTSTTLERISDKGLGGQY